jgi:predicted amidophosphoribosyltransferase
MRICCCCQTWGHGLLCDRCSAGLQPGAESHLPTGVRVAAAFAHQTAARRLIHLHKYQGMASAGSVLAKAMVPLLPADAEALIPVPRATLRRVRYGTDPALSLARLIEADTGVPVLRALVPQLWWAPHAGSSRSRRRPPRFRLTRTVPPGSILVDDVLTTGATIAAAAKVSGVRRALTATRAGG